MVAVNEVKTDWTISCPHKQFTRTGLWESEHIITWRILGSLLFIFFLLRTLAVGSYFAKYYVRERIPSGLPVALEPSHWCVHFLMPWVNTPNCFRDEHYERNQTDNHNQDFGIGAHKKMKLQFIFPTFLFSDPPQGFQLYNGEMHLIPSWRKKHNLHVILFVYQEQVDDFFGVEG